MGKLFGANQIILGSIGKIGDVFTLSAKLVDVESVRPNYVIFVIQIIFYGYF